MIVRFIERIRDTYHVELMVHEFSNLKGIEDYLQKHLESISMPAYSKQAATESSIQLEQLAYMLQERREAMDERIAFVVSSLEELEEKLYVFVKEDTIPGGSFAMEDQDAKFNKIRNTKESRTWRNYSTRSFFAD